MAHELIVELSTPEEVHAVLDGEKKIEIDPAPSSKMSREEIIDQIGYNPASEGALDALASVVNTKASQADLNALSTVVNTKASQTDLNALSTVVDTKASQVDLEEGLSHKADVIVNSASGSIASFSDGAAYPVKQTVFSINPVQDLHGYEYPWPEGGRKNLVDWVGPQTITTQTVIVRLDTSEQAIFTASVTAVNNASINGALNLYVYNGNTLVKSKQTPILANAPSARYSVTLDLSDTTFDNIRISISGASAGYSLTISDAQLEKGETATPFTPYSNICPISGHTEVDAVRTGKNLLDPTQKERTSNTVARWHYSDGYVMREGVTYALSSDTTGVTVYIIDRETDTSIKSGSPYIIYTPTEDVLVYFRAYLSSGISPVNLQLEINPVATAYEAFNGQSVTYQLGQTVYAGTLTINEDGTGQIVATNAIYNLADLQYRYIAAQQYFYATTALPNYKQVTAYYKPIGIICSQYKSGTCNSTPQSNCEITVTINSSYVRIRDDAYSDVTKFIAMLSANSAQVCYELAEPVIINLTEQEIIETLYGQNNIWHDANGDTTVTYRADTKTYVNNLVTEENTSIIAPIETGTTASQAYAVGKYFLLNNQFCKAKTAIASGATFTLNTNYEVTTIADELYAALHS